MSQIKLGDFSNLAQDYSKFRPGYSENITERILAASFKKIYEMTVLSFLINKKASLIKLIF